MIDNLASPFFIPLFEHVNESKNTDVSVFFSILHTSPTNKLLLTIKYFMVIFSNR